MKTLHRLTLLYLLANVRSISLVSLCFLAAIMINVAVNVHFEITALVKSVPIAFLLATSISLLILWPIWIVNVWLSARVKRLKFGDFVRGADYLDLLKRDNKP